MQWTGMGKIAVAASGAPVPLSLVLLKVNTLLITYDPVDVNVPVFVKDVAGNVIAVMASPNAAPVQFTAPGGNQLDLRNFQIDASTNGKGPYVSYGVD